MPPDGKSLRSGSTREGSPVFDELRQPSDLQIRPSNSPAQAERRAVVERVIERGKNLLTDLAARIRAEHEATAVAMQRGVEHAINAGRLLIEAKQIVHRGDWLPWLRDHCQVSERMAQRYMLLARHASELEANTTRVSDMTVRGALKLLAPDKQARRAEREAELGATQLALPAKKYGVIVADPEWRFEPWSRETGMDRAADNHYPTSCTEVIAARDVASIAADGCVLFLWATAPMLPQALEVLTAWGFEYRSHVVWVKDHIGTGYWFRNKHELLLVGTRGEIPAPAPGEQWPSAINAPVEEHSAKPEIFLEMIEGHFRSLPKIELNRRGAARPGWDAWGNEVAPEISHQRAGEQFASNINAGATARRKQQAQYNPP
jgi:N6-adenosine-specific RNA methylase IME4